MFTHGMEFDLGEDIGALRDMVHRFAQERIKPIAAEVDRTNSFPNDLWREMGDLGLLGITVGEEYGGSGMGYLAHTIAVEEIARASAAVPSPSCALYSQWAATPASAMTCISSVRIWNSMFTPEGPTSVVCSDW